MWLLHDTGWCLIFFGLEFRYNSSKSVVLMNRIHKTTAYDNSVKSYFNFHENVQKHCLNPWLYVQILSITEPVLEINCHTHWRTVCQGSSLSWDADDKTPNIHTFTYWLRSQDIRDTLKHIQLLVIFWSRTIYSQSYHHADILPTYYYKYQKKPQSWFLLRCIDTPFQKRIEVTI